MIKRLTKPFLVAVSYFVLVILIAHFFVPSGYDWRQNTISDLASQGYTYKWIMQAGLIGFGGMLLVGMLGYFKKNPKGYFLVFVAVYGLSILFSGIFCTKPIDPALPYSAPESNLHSIFATVGGISMSLGILWQMFASANNGERWTRLTFLMLVVGLSGLFGLAENHVLQLDKGIVQRFLYLAGLAWLVYEERILLKKDVR